MRKVWQIIIILLVVYFIFLIRQDIIDNLDLRADCDQTTKLLDQEQRLADRLADRLGRLKGSELIEEIARTDLGLIKKGETAFKVVR